MSLYYQVSLECNADEAVASECQEFLRGYLEFFPSAFVSRHVDFDGQTWVNLSIPESAIDEATWMQGLQKVWQGSIFDLPFRFAIAGLEVEQARTHAELLEETDWDIFDHVALSDPLWQAVGCPDGFVSVGLHHVKDNSTRTP